MAIRDLVAEQLPGVERLIEVLPHGHDDDSEVGFAPEVSRPGGHLRLVTWGALIPMKGVHLLVDAIGRLEDPESVTLDIWGEFPAHESEYEAELVGKADGWPIHFRGAFQPSDIPSETYDLAVFPSICFESYSFTLDEAWDRGLPAVVPDRGALAERVGGAGATFRADDAAALAEVLEGLITAPKWIDEWRGAIPSRPSMAEHEELIAGVYSRVRDLAVESIASDHERRRERLAGLAIQLERRDAELYRLRGRVDQERDRASHLDHEVALREDGLKTKDELLESFNHNLGKLASALEGREIELSRMSEIQARQATEFEERLADRDQDLEAKDQSLAEFAESVANLDQEIQAKDIALTDFVKSTEEFRSALDEAKRRHEERETLWVEQAVEREQAFEATARADQERAREGFDLELAEAGRRHEAVVAALREEFEAETRRFEEKLAGLTDRAEEGERRAGRLDTMRNNLHRELRASEGRACLGEEALGRALEELAISHQEHHLIHETVRDQLLVVAEEALGAPMPGATGSEIIERVRANHGRLHHLIEERDSLLDAFVDGFGASENGAGGSDGSATGRPGPIKPVGPSLKGRLERWKRRRRNAVPGRRRLLFVIHDFLPKHSAGTEIYTYHLVKQLMARHDVHLLFCEARHEQARYTVSHGVYDGLPYTEVVHNYHWENFEETYHDPRMEEIFATVLDDFDPDLVHVQHLHHFSFNFIPMVKARGIPVVYTLHEFMLLCARGGQLLREDLEICELPDPERCADCIRHHRLAGDYGQSRRSRAADKIQAMLPDQLQRAWIGYHGPVRSGELSAEERVVFTAAAKARLDFISECVREVDLFISPSAFLRDKFIESGMIAEDRIIHSDNGFDTSPFDGVARVPSETLRFGFVGTISEYKGIHILIEAFNPIEEDDVELQIWGDLETFQDYKERIVPMVANPRIKLLGRFDNTRIAEVLAGIDVLIVPSLWFENSPLTIHEAWLAGIPVLASDRGGMAELVDDDVNGFHFKLGDPADLRDKARRIIADRSLLERFSGRVGQVKRIADNAREIEGYYERLIREASSR